jgi:hypothetical protein
MFGSVVARMGRQPWQGLCTAQCMLRLLFVLSVIGGLCAAAASARAADGPRDDGPQARVESTIYGASGDLGVRTNEADSAFDEHSVGFGVLSSFRPSHRRESEDAVGSVLLLGLTSELRARRTVHCGLSCPPGEFVNGSALGARAGGGYDFRAFGFRVGVLYSAGSAVLVHPMLLPDVALRLGPRDIAYLSLGLGAYDAPTSVRPGLYVGLSVVLVPRLTASVHYGAHFELGSFGETVFQADPRLDLTLEYALSPRLSVAMGGVSQPSVNDHQMYEAHATLGLGF